MYLQNKKIKNITKTKKSMHSKSGPMSKSRQCSPYSITAYGTRKAMNLERICDIQMGHKSFPSLEKWVFCRQ